MSRFFNTFVFHFSVNFFSSFSIRLLTIAVLLLLIRTRLKSEFSNFFFVTWGSNLRGDQLSSISFGVFNNNVGDNENDIM